MKEEEEDAGAQVDIPGGDVLCSWMDGQDNQPV
jgi:hypothetical protein